MVEKFRPWYKIKTKKMISSRDFKIGFIVIISTVLLGTFLFFMVKKDMKCDEHVVLVDGTEYDCRGVSSFNNNMSCITLCDGERIGVPTNRIKIITKIK